MMKTPAVSILIPTYNYARYLPEAIESVLDQNFADFELIIADDASSDNTVDVCEAYAANDSRIRFVRHEKNLGMVENWNWCLQQAGGHYIKYMLADDKFLRPYALRRLVEAFEKNPGISLVTSARALIDESSRVAGLWNKLGLRNRIYDGKSISIQCLGRNQNLIGEPTAVLFRREDAQRGFDPAFCQLVDLEMWLHLLQAGGLAYLGEPLCCFRRHAGQQTEVNQMTGVGLGEMIRLADYMPTDKVRRMYFRCMHQMKKSDGPEYEEILARLSREFSPFVYGVSYLEYTTFRLIENCRHFFSRRPRFSIRINKG